MISRYPLVYKKHSESLKINTLKIPQLLLHYLLQNQSLSLQGIGRINLNAQSGTSLDEKGEMIIIPGSISFEHDPHALPDARFAEFICKETGKMKPLAESDIDSYIQSGHQLLIISKPFLLEHIGVLRKNKLNEIEFTQGEMQVEKEEHRTRKKSGGSKNEETIFSDASYATPTLQRSRGSQWVTLIILLLLGIGLLGWVSWYFYNRSAYSDQIRIGSFRKIDSPEDSIKILSQSTVKDTILTSAVVSDSTGNSAVDSSLSATFHVVLLVANKEKAQRRYDSLVKWGHRVVLTTEDSVLYKISMPIHAPLSDTTHYKDSLSVFFGRRSTIEIH